MGFLKNFKEDLSQAMNELLPEDKTEEDNDEQMVNTLETDKATQASDSERLMELLDTLTSEEDSSTKLIDKEDKFKDDAIEVDEILEDDALEDDTLDDEILEDDTLEDDTLEDDTLEEMEDILEEHDLEEMEDALEEDILPEDMEYSENIITLDTMIMEDDEMDDNIDLELLDALAEEEDEVEETIEKAAPKLKASAVASDDEVTVISKGTTITGSISSDGSLDIMGSITGDIECLGKLSITGKVNGNSTAAEVYVNTERMEGSINSEGSIKIGLGTVVIGDVIASSGVIAGAVKGEIDINGPIVIDSTAIIKGNIKAKSVQINNGAVIEGFCSLSYSSVDVDNIFE